MSSTDERHTTEERETALAAEYDRLHAKTEEVPDLMAALMASVNRIKDARKKTQPKTNEEQGHE